jgi:hypothetical protein
VNKRSFGGRFRSAGRALPFVLPALALTLPGGAHAQELRGAQEPELPSARELLGAWELPDAEELPTVRELPTVQKPQSAQELPSEHKTQSRLFTSDEVIEFSLETNFVKLKADRGLDPSTVPRFSPSRRTTALPVRSTSR